MSLMNSKQKKSYRYQVGDFIGAREASELCGYRSPRQFQVPERIEFMVKEFRSVGCTLTTDIWVGGQRRFLRSEIDAYLSRLVDVAIQQNEKRRGVLKLVI